MPNPTTPRSRYRTATRAHCSASSTSTPRYTSGVNRTVTPYRSYASTAPSVYPVNSSSQPTPRCTRSHGEKMASRYTAPNPAASAA